jgi:hypothetical protein
MRIGTNIIVSALHDPVRLAEDATAIALLTGDRFELGLGLGYHEREFSGFGRRLKQRPSLLEDSIEVIKHAWTADSTRYEGKRYSSPPLPVTPKPEHAPHILIGAQALLDAGVYRLMDASMAVEDLVGMAAACPQIRDFHYWAQLPGESVESGSERVQYLADKVIPEVTRRLAEHSIAQPA